MLSSPVCPFFILKTLTWQAVHLSPTLALCCSWLKVTAPGLSFPCEKVKSGGTFTCPLAGARSPTLLTTEMTAAMRPRRIGITIGSSFR